MTTVQSKEALTSTEIEVKGKPSQEAINSLMKTIGDLCGSANKEFGEITLTQLKGSCYPGMELEESAMHVIANMVGIGPKDHLEGMLATQMMATYYAAMNCFMRAAKPDASPQMYQENINAANKLTRSFVTQMEALNRYRGKGQQKVTVEHVHVHSGGQAVVGTITSEKGGN